MSARKPYTPVTLAERWGCSQGLVRKMIDRHELSHFRLGTLIRIPASEVERVECQHIPSNDCEADMPSSGKTAESGEGEDSTPKIDRARRPRHADYGKVATILHGRWGD